MISELAVSHEEDSESLLELVYTDDEGTTFVRENGEWMPVDSGLNNPTVFDVPLVFVTEEFVPIYDEKDDLTVSDTTPYQVI